MKKLLFTLLAALLASGAFAQDTAFPDIPANHWAGDAVARIADLGIVIGFPDGTFRGNESFTRYQAALVISRLLDVINEDFDARMAMSEEDMASLRNALQELASDVAAQGVRLAAAESAIAGLSDEVSANSDRISALENAMADMPMDSGMDEGVIQDLQNQISSLRVGLDTAQAQAEAAQARADEAFDMASQAMALARQNADEIAALTTLLNEILPGLGGDEFDPSGILADLGGLADRVSRAESDIANIREFVILLRRDQVALRDRVSALEASDTAQDALIADLLDRVTAIEENPLGISGSIELEYYVGRTIGEEFDIDRVFGMNNERAMNVYGRDVEDGYSIFSSGAADLNDDDDETDDGEEAQDREDITPATGDTAVTLNLSIGAGSIFNGAGDSNAFNSFETVLTITVEEAFGLCSVEVDQGPADEVICPDDADGDNLFSGYVFTIDDFTTTFDPIGAAPLTFQFGEDVTATFTPYILDVDNDGFVATIGAPDFLAFLDPTLTAVYASLGSDDYLRAARLTLSPFDALALGGSFAQVAEMAADKDDVLGDNVNYTVFGVDASLAVSVFDLNVEWANSATTEDVLYAELNIDTAGFPILDGISVNYRDIAGDWETGLPDELDGDGDEYPFELDQAGFAVMVGLNLFILDVDGYFDAYTTGSPSASTTAFGVDVSADLFAGFALTGFFHNVAIDGTVVDDNGATERDNDYDTGFGVGLVHDGDADNALIDNLDLEFEFGRLGAGFNETHILASADYELAIGFLTLTPYASYESFQDADAASDDTVEIKAGTGLMTDPLGVFLAPSLQAAVNYRTNSHTDTGATDYTATELQYSVGIMFNEFLFENSTLSASYGSYTGTNMQLAMNSQCPAGGGTAAQCSDTATDISDGDSFNGATQSTSGYEIVWTYFDLELAYGVYQNSITGGGVGVDRAASAQAFRIAYTVNF